MTKMGFGATHLLNLFNLFLQILRNAVALQNINYHLKMGKMGRFSCKTIGKSDAFAPKLPLSTEA